MPARVRQLTEGRAKGDVVNQISDMLRHVEIRHKNQIERHMALPAHGSCPRELEVCFRKELT